MENTYIDEQMKKALELLENRKFHEALNAYEMIDLRSATISQKILLLNDIGLIYKNLGLYSEAEKKYSEAINIYIKNNCSETQIYLYLLNNLAVLKRIKGEYKKAESYYKRILVLTEIHLGKDTEYYSEELNNLAVLYFNIANYSKTEKLFLESFEIKKKLHGEISYECTLSLNNLAVLYHAKKEYKTASIYYKKTIDNLQKLNFTESLNYKKIYYNYISVLFELGEKQKASNFLHNFKPREDSTNQYTVQYARFLLDYSKLLVKIDRKKEALALLGQCMEINKSQTGKGTLLYTEILSENAILLNQFEEFKESIHFLFEAVILQNEIFVNTSFSYEENKALMFLKKINNEYNLLLNLILTHTELQKENLQDVYLKHYHKKIHHP